MKTLKPTIYKSIASVITADDESYRSATNIILFSRVLTMYPSKNIWFQICHRVISYIERNIRSMSIVLETMSDEGEDPEIISNIQMIRQKPLVKTPQEVSQLCIILNDYVKYAKILQAKDSFIQTLDMMEEDDCSIHDTVEGLYKMSGDIISAYNAVNVASFINKFDSSDVESMKTAIAQAQDLRSSNRIIVTGIRALNNLLSPGYVGGNLYLYMGCPGCYKSGILLDGHVSTCKYNAHILNVMSGKTPISMYISMENTMAQTIRRLWALLFPTADMSMFTVDEICEMINKELASNGFRSVILYYGYREKSTIDLGNIIRSFNTETSQVVAVFLDYIKRIRPGRTDIAATSSEKTELHTIMNELKALAAQFEIPIVSGHQLNRAAAQKIDATKKGGIGRTADAMSRGDAGSAWETVEVADTLILINIEIEGDNKYLTVKAVKQRDLDSNTDISMKQFAHPFISLQAFGLKHDIMENCSISLPIYDPGRNTANFIASNI